MKITAKTKFKIGDVVRIGDGPRMVVNAVEPSHVHCIWFGINERAQWTGPHRRRFRRGQITRVQREASR